MSDPNTPTVAATAGAASPAPLSGIADTIAKAASMLGSVAQVLAGMQPNTVLGEGAAVVAEIAPAVVAEAKGDAAGAQAAETAILSDFVARAEAYEKAHGVDLVTVIHEMATRIFGGPKGA